MKTVKLFRDQYPPLLTTLEKIPPHLYCAGKLPPTFEYTYLCVVGPRKFSEYGRDACRTLIKGLRNYPIVIVSGLAIGIDSIAHTAALEVGLKTLSYPGSGLSRATLYPAAHYELAERIVEAGGTILSPFEPEQIGAHWTFPVRNQLMAGSSKATLVIEGAEDSGTLITAKAAVEMGRDVMVVPGSIFSKYSYAPHYLFSEGATPVFTAEDILKVLNFDVREERSLQDKFLDLEKLCLTKTELHLVRTLQYGASNASELIKRTSLSATIFNALISELELREIIVQENGLIRANL